MSNCPKCGAARILLDPPKYDCGSRVDQELIETDRCKLNVAEAERDDLRAENERLQRENKRLWEDFYDARPGEQA